MCCSEEVNVTMCITKIERVSTEELSYRYRCMDCWMCLSRLGDLFFRKKCVLLKITCCMYYFSAICLRFLKISQHWVDVLHSWFMVYHYSSCLISLRSVHYFYFYSFALLFAFVHVWFSVHVWFIFYNCCFKNSFVCKK